MSDTPAALLKDFYTARKIARKGVRDERAEIREGRMPWGSFNSSIEDYDRYFSKVLHGSIESFLTRAQQEKGKAFALDAFGQGGFFAVAPIDGEAFMTLAEPRPKAQIGEDRRLHHREGVIGDVLQGKTWRKLDKYLRRHREEMNGGFDLITLRPTAGWGHIIGSRYENSSERSSYAYDLEWVILNKLFAVLSPQGGTLVSQKSTIQFGSEYTDWITKLNTIEGVGAEEDATSIRITRLSDAVSRLPRISDSQKAYDPELLRLIDEMFKT